MTQQSMHWTAGLHHDGSTLYVSNPLPRLGETVRVRLRAPYDAPIRGVFLRTCPDGETHNAIMHIVARDSVTVWYEAELRISMPLNPYRFKVLADDGAYYFTALGVSRADGPDAGDFKLVADFAAPAWLEDTVFYQIFPDRFHNGDPSNDVPPGAWTYREFRTQQRAWGLPPLTYAEGGTVDFFGGDLAGIAQKIGYLRDLGVTALYLTPIFTARTNHRYDIMDFFNVDPHLGGNEALIALRRALDEAGMRIVLDVTLNHTGRFNPWFLEAQASEQSPYAEFFTFYQRPEDYECWLGHKSLPKWNYRSQKVRDVLYRGQDSVLRHWLRAPFRIDGWRLDVANMQGRQGKYQLGHEIGRELRQAVKADNPDAYLVGEHFHDGTPHLAGDELDASMNYQGFTFPVRRFLAGGDLGTDWNADHRDTSLLPAETIVEQMTRFMAAVPWAVSAMQFNLLDSHDTTRFLTVTGGNKARLRMAVALLMTFPGAPCIYYGDEIGMMGHNDPFNRACMIWDESGWDQALRTYYQKLVALRRTSPALRKGGMQFLYAQGSLLVYQRHAPDARLILAARRGSSPETLIIPVWQGGIADGTTFREFFSGTLYRVQGGRLALGAAPEDCALILEEVRG